MRLLPGVKSYVLQMRFKPMPKYEHGLVVAMAGADAVGTMIIQPDVEDATGARRKLDDVLGPWFALIGWEADPQSGLSEADRRFWRELGAKFVQINRARSGPRPGLRLQSTAGTECVEDVDNAFADWITAHPCQVVVLRPDRYVAAQSSLAGLAEVTAQLRAFTPAAQQARKEAA